MFPNLRLMQVSLQLLDTINMGNLKTIQRALSITPELYEILGGRQRAQQPVKEGKDPLCPEAVG